MVSPPLAPCIVTNIEAFAWELLGTCKAFVCLATFLAAASKHGNPGDSTSRLLLVKSILGSFPKNPGALIWTQKSRALIIRTPAKWTQLVEMAKS